MVENLGKQGFHYLIKVLLEPISEAITDKSQEILEKTEPTTEAYADLDESNVHVKAVELMSRNGVVHSISIRPIAKLLVPTNKSQFQLYDDPDSDNWNDYKMKGEKVTIYKTN